MGRCWGNTRSYIDHRDQTILTRDSRENVQIRTDWPFLIKNINKIHGFEHDD